MPNRSNAPLVRVALARESSEDHEPCDQAPESGPLVFVFFARDFEGVP